jgi:glycosyltransferase involved in cell wall biosynthesis
MERPRGLFAIPSLRCGGAERVFTLLLNGLAAAGLDMHVALCQREGHWLSRLSPEVSVHDLNAPRVRQAAWSLVQLVRRLRPHSVLSTSSHLNSVSGLCRPFFPRETRLFLREVSINHFDPSYLKGLRGSLMRRAYRAADGVIALTDSMRPMIEQNLGVPGDRVVRIFNPVQLTRETLDSGRRPSASDARKILAVGSLTQPKGMDRLIAEFPALLTRFPSSRLTILGEGPERGSLERQIRSLNMGDHIHLAGFCADVRSHLAQADLFVLPSRFEGMPNALLEAISARCPVVVLDHPGGTREVMSLLGEERRITQSLESWKAEWFEPLSDRTLQLARLHFGFDAILKQYAGLLFGKRARARQAA